MYIGDCERRLKIFNLSNLDKPEWEIDLLDTWALSILFYQNYLIIGTDDHKIKVFENKTFKLMDEIEGHQDGVLYMELAADLLYSASFDKKILCWNLQEIESRILERKIMVAEDCRSKKLEVYLKVLPRKKKKKRGKKKKKAKK